MGKVNFNTVNHREVLLALTEPNGENIFTEADVDNAFYNPQEGLLSLRSGKKAGPTDEKLANGGPVDRPFLGFGVGEVIPISVDEKVSAAKHPYQKMELLTKIFNHFTTRSNTFAIWVTVGFFEVVDETTVPPRLGAEIGKAENRQIRHRMFAIVDRTQMKAFETYASGNIPNPATTPLPSQQPISLIDPTTNQPTMGGNISITDQRTGRSWNVTEGTVLVYDPGEDNEEAVIVRKDTNGNLVADFSRYHRQGCRVICHGNPGPWARYDPRKDTDVVPYFQLID